MKQKQLKILLFVFLISQVAFYSFAPLYALFAIDIDSLSPSRISYIWSGYSLLTAIFILIMGFLENKEKKGKMISIGYALFGLGSLLLLNVDTELDLIIALSVSALAAGITFPAYKTMFAKRESRGRESEQWAWLDASNMFAAAIGAAIGGLIIGYYGFDKLFIAMASLQLLAAIISFKYFYNTP